VFVQETVKAICPKTRVGPILSYYMAGFIIHRLPVG